MSGLSDGKPRGIPWTAVLDADGKVLATSDGPDGNIGFPSSAEEIDHFMAMLRTSATRLTEADFAAIKAALGEK